MKKKSLIFFFGCTILLGWISSTSVAWCVPINQLYFPTEYSSPRTEKITHVVIHFISNAGTNPRYPYNLTDVYQLFLGSQVSAHYLIGRGGEIFQLVAEDRVAFHAGHGGFPEFPEYLGGMNDYSIGIELLAIGTREEMQPMVPGDMYDLIAPSDIGYKDAQYRSLNYLLEAILKRHPAIQRDRFHIIGHDEYAPFRKTDPGMLFDWSRIKVIKASDRKQNYKETSKNDYKKIDRPQSRFP